MTPEQSTQLAEIHTMLTRKDNAGYTGLSDGHNLYGRVCRTEQQLERTDNAGHKTANGHNLFGRVNMLQEDMATVKSQISSIQKLLKTINEKL